MNMLASAGMAIRPFGDDPLLVVRAVDREIVRAEFFKSYAADGDARQRAETRRKAFGRATSQAQARELIGIREIDGITWL